MEPVTDLRENKYFYDQRIDNEESMIERALAVDEESDSKTELESMASPSMTNQPRREQSPKRQR